MKKMYRIILKSHRSSVYQETQISWGKDKKEAIEALWVKHGKRLDGYDCYVADCYLLSAM